MQKLHFPENIRHYIFTFSLSSKGGWLVGPLVGQLDGQLDGQLVRWSVGQLVSWSVGPSTLIQTETSQQLLIALVPLTVPGGHHEVDV